MAPGQAYILGEGFTLGRTEQQSWAVCSLPRYRKHERRISKYLGTQVIISYSTVPLRIRVNYAKVTGSLLSFKYWLSVLNSLSNLNKKALAVLYLWLAFLLDQTYWSYKLEEKRLLSYSSAHCELEIGALLYDAHMEHLECPAHIAFSLLLINKWRGTIMTAMRRIWFGCILI